MKTLLTVLFLAVCAFAQDQAAVNSALSACGPKDTRVEFNANQSARTQPEAGKALVYVIEDDGVANNYIGAGVTIRVGVDGTWIGATNLHHSYVSFDVSPGEHHLCANWQTRFVSTSKAVSLAHMEAEAGKVYYFRIRKFGEQTIFIDLNPIDGDEGKFLVATADVSRSKR